jgi:hypothetical protein
VWNEPSLAVLDIVSTLRTDDVDATWGGVPFENGACANSLDLAPISSISLWQKPLRPAQSENIMPASRVQFPTLAVARRKLNEAVSWNHGQESNLIDHSLSNLA